MVTMKGMNQSSRNLNLYNFIAKHPNPREIYLNKLEAEGVITKEEALEIRKRI
jgi:2-oxoglutarate dehydrogenase complex dehydrogenase (E1) component-like enzyme